MSHGKMNSTNMIASKKTTSAITDKDPCGKILFFWLTVFIAILAGLYQNYPALLSHYIVVNDARGNIFWLHNLIDSSLFTDDYLTDFSVHFQSMGMYYLFKFSSYIINPFLLVKILPFIFIVINSILIYKIGMHVVNPLTGLISCITFLFFPSHLDYFSIGSYSNLFAWASVFAFIYIMIAKNKIHLIWLIPLISLFYPIVFLLAATCYSLWLITSLFSDDSLHIKRRSIYIFLASMLISALVILPKYSVSNSQFGSSINHQTMLKSPALYKHGRNHILPHKSPIKAVHKIIRAPFYIFSLLLLFSILGRELIQKIPLEIWLYALSGILLYEVSYWVLLKFHFPYKYTRYGFEAALILVIGLGVGLVVEKINGHIKKAVAVLVFLCYGFYFYSSQLEPAYGMTDYSRKSPLYDYITNNIPKNSLIAAPPYLADNIPLFSARRVLFSHELLAPWYTKHSVYISEAINNFYRAYFSKNKNTIKAFREKYKVDYIIVNKKDFYRKNKWRFYVEPYNRGILKTRDKNKGHFLLRARLNKLSEFKFKSYYVINLQQFD